MARLDKIEARAILTGCCVPLGADFHTLSSGQVEDLLTAAKQFGYRAPKVRNGSAARYWHAYLTRTAMRAGW